MLISSLQPTIQSVDLGRRFFGPFVFRLDKKSWKHTESWKEKILQKREELAQQKVAETCLRYLSLDY